MRSLCSRTSILVIGAAILGSAALFTATAADEPGCLGVRLMPVPELLRVHLGLEEGQGQMIINVVADSGADKAGLERYDVITGADGEQVADYQAFVDHIQSVGAGAEVKLTVISSGQKREVAVTLGSQPEGEPEWNYSGGPTDTTREPQTRTYRWSFPPQPFDDEGSPFEFPEGLDRFFRKEYRLPDEGEGGGTVIIGDEELQKRLEQLEERLSTLEEKQSELNEKLDRLLEEQ